MNNKLDDIVDKQRNIGRNINNLREISKYNPNAQKSISDLEHISDNLEHKYYDISRKHDDMTGFRPSNLSYLIDRGHRNERWLTNDDADVWRIKERFGQGKYNMKSYLEQKPKNKYLDMQRNLKNVKESVDDTIFNIYEAYDNGYIDIDEATTMLELLENIE